MQLPSIRSLVCFSAEPSGAAAGEDLPATSMSSGKSFKPPPFSCQIYESARVHLDFPIS